MPPKTKHLPCIVVISSVLLLSAVAVSPVNAENRNNARGRHLLAGYGWDMRLENGDEYSYYFLGLNLDYGSGEDSWQRYFSVQLEPFVSVIEAGRGDFETGISFFLKYEPRWGFPLKPYIRGGSGLIYLSETTEKQSTNFNFVSQAAYGLSYRRKNINLLVEYRNRHISNAGIRDPNSGIDTKMLLAGMDVSF